MQTKEFDEESKESQGNKSVANVASDLKGLLEGSCRINDKKAGVGSLFCITSVPKVCPVITLTNLQHLQIMPKEHVTH